MGATCWMMEKPNNLVEEGFIYPSPFRGDETHHYIMVFAEVAGILNGTKINATGRQPHSVDKQQRSQGRRWLPRIWPVLSGLDILESMVEKSSGRFLSRANL